MDGAAHRFSQRGINQAVTVDHPLAGERRRDNRGREVIAPAGRIGDADVGIGKRGPDARANLVRGDGHGAQGYSTQAVYSSWMRLGTRVTVVTTLLVASVLGASAYAVLRLRKADLEADLRREGREIGEALQAGIEPLDAAAAEATLDARVRAGRAKNDIFQLEVIRIGNEWYTDD